MNNIVHYVRNSLPLQAGYTLRTHYIAHNLIHAGKLVSVYNCLRSSPPGNSGNVGNELYRHFQDPVPYYWLSDSAPDKGGSGQRLGRLSEIRSKLFKKRHLHQKLNRYAAEIKKETGKPDIIHAHSSPDVGAEGFDLASLFGIPFIYEIRGFWKLSAAADRMVDMSIARAVKKDIRVAKKAQHVVTICNAMADILIDNGIPANRITVVPNGFDGGVFQPVDADQDLNENLNLEDKFIFGYISNIRALEGIQTVIEAWPDIVRQNPRAVFLVMGDGKFLPDLKNLVKQKGVQDSFLFLGKIPHDEIAAYYSILDVFVIPRLALPVCNIVTPLKPFEAMAMGIPVLSSDAAALLEIVEDNRTGTVFKAGDSQDFKNQCIKIMENPAGIRTIAQNALKWVHENREWSNIVKQYIEIYERL